MKSSKDKLRDKLREKIERDIRRRKELIGYRPPESALWHMKHKPYQKEETDA